MRFFSTRQKGFTLVEIVLVAAIIAIVAAVVVANIQGARKKSRDAQRVSDMQQIQLALRLYKDANGAYPDCPEGMQVGMSRANDCPNADTINVDLLKYLPSLPYDPLGTGAGNAYVYDSALRCATEGSSGPSHTVIYAKVTEVAGKGNWLSVCGTRNGTADAAIKGTLPTTGASIWPSNSAANNPTYGIILK